MGTIHAGDLTMSALPEVAPEEGRKKLKGLGVKKKSHRSTEWREEKLEKRTKELIKGKGKRIW